MSKATCSIENCAKPSRARGWCWAHYQNWRRNGDVNHAPPTSEERFWANVNKSGECWEWTGWKDDDGYGSFCVDGANVPVHRYSFTLQAERPIAPRLDIDHICHNASCVRPDHLREATRKQNAEHRAGAQVNSSTGVRGVYFDAQKNAYLGIVGHNGRRVYAGKFASIEEAEVAVIAKRLELFTHNNADRMMARA